MKTTIHRANERGHVKFDWLNSHHSFSFGNYYNPEKMSFGLLRVLNDDIIDGGSGFGMHPHDNMEIISIPIYGGLEHRDSTGTHEVIKEHDVQIMSAGTGIRHSEFNHYKDKASNFLQIWIIPGKRNISPRYSQKTFNPQDRVNKLQTVVAPDNQEAVWINQDAWISLGDLQNSFSTTYTLNKKGNGVYVFVIEGSLNINGTDLLKRDAIGIWDTGNIDITSTTDSKIILIEVPMTFSNN